MKLTPETRGQNFVVYAEGYIRIDGVRLSFPHIAHPQIRESDETDAQGNPVELSDYNLVAILSKDTHAAARKALVDMNNKLLKEKADNQGKVPAVSQERRYLKDGDAVDEGGNRLHRPEYENAWFINAANQRRPTARDGRGGKIEDLSVIEETFPSGIIANILVRPWFFDGKSKRNPKKTFPTRLSCGLEAVQFAKDDGVRFGAERPNDDDVWEVQDGAESPFDDANGDDDEL